MPGVHAVITAQDLKRVLKTFYQGAAGGETGEHASEEAAEDANIRAHQYYRRLIPRCASSAKRWRP